MAARGLEMSWSGCLAEMHVPFYIVVLDICAVEATNGYLGTEVAMFANPQPLLQAVLPPQTGPLPLHWSPQTQTQF